METTHALADKQQKDVKAGSNLPEALEQAKPADSPAAAGEVRNEFSANSFSTYFTWRGNGTVRLNCGHAGINANSRVVASISEYNTDPRQNRFMGDAVMSISNVSPYNGGVVVRLNVGWRTPLNVRVDFFVDSSPV